MENVTLEPAATLIHPFLNISDPVVRNPFESTWRVPPLRTSKAPAKLEAVADVTSIWRMALEFPAIFHMAVESSSKAAVLMCNVPAVLA